MKECRYVRIWVDRTGKHIEILEVKRDALPVLESDEGKATPSRFHSILETLYLCSMCVIGFCMSWNLL